MYLIMKSYKYTINALQDIKLTFVQIYWREYDGHNKERFIYYIELCASLISVLQEIKSWNQVFLTVIFSFSNNLFHSFCNN